MGAPDNTYDSGTNQAGSARPDLGRFVGLWSRDGGAPGPLRPGFLAMRCTRGFSVARPEGMFSFPTKRTMFAEDPDAMTGLRPLNAPNYPDLERDRRETYNVQCVDRGFADPIDERDLEVVDERTAGFSVEQRKAIRAWNHLQQVLDRVFLTPLGAASTPFTGLTDVDASSTPLTTTSNSAIALFDTGRERYTTLYGVDENNAMMLEQKTFRALSRNDDLLGANVDVSGGAPDEVIAGRLAALLDLDYIYVGFNGSALGDDIIVFHEGTESHSFPRPYFVPEGYPVDARGVQVFDRMVEADNGVIRRIGAGTMCDFKIPKHGGFRIKNALNA